jgi:hypothetical protein
VQERLARDLADHQTGVEACDRYLERAMVCTRLPEGMRAPFAQSFAVFRRRAEQEGGAAALELEDFCRQASFRWEQTLTMMGC